MIRDGFSNHGRVDVLTRLGEEFEIVFHDEFKQTADITFSEIPQEVDFPVKEFTQNNVAVVVYKGQQHAINQIASFFVDREDHLLEIPCDANADGGIRIKNRDVVKADETYKAKYSTHDVTDIRTSHKVINVDGVFGSQTNFKRRMKRKLTFFAAIKQDHSKAVAVVGCSNFENVEEQRVFLNRSGFTEIYGDFGRNPYINVNQGKQLFLLNLAIGRSKFTSALAYGEGVAYNVFVICDCVSGLEIEVNDVNRRHITRFSFVSEAQNACVFTGPIYGTLFTNSLDRVRSFELSLSTLTQRMQIRLNRCLILRLEELHGFTNNDVFTATCFSLYYSGIRYYYPDQQTINCLCATQGKRSALVLQQCNEACDYIRKVSRSVMDAYPAYHATCTNPASVVFVVTLHHYIDLSQFLDYTIRIRLHRNYFEEGQLTEIEKCSISHEEQTRVSACIRKYGQRLMDEHRYLGIKTAGPVRRTRSYHGLPRLRKQTCLMLYVHMKDYIPLTEEPFEKEYDGIPVDIRSGEFRLFGNDYFPSLENIRMGSQIYRNGTGHCGTLGGFIDHPHYGACGFTSAHVLLNSSEFETLKSQQHGLIYNSHDNTYNVWQGCDNPQEIGRIMKAVYKGKNIAEESVGVEVALFKIHHRPPVDGLLCSEEVITFNSGEIRDITHINVADKCCKIGCITGKTEGKLVVQDGSTRVRTYNYNGVINNVSAELPNQFEIYPIGSTFADLGDSGALVFCEDYQANLVCIGMLEGGTGHGTCIVTPITAVLDALGVARLKDFTHTIGFAGQLASLEEKFGQGFQNLKSEISHVNQNLEQLQEGLNTQIQSGFQSVYRNLQEELKSMFQKN